MCYVGPRGYFSGFFVFEGGHSLIRHSWCWCPLRDTKPWPLKVLGILGRAFNELHWRFGTHFSGASEDLCDYNRIGCYASWEHMASMNSFLKSCCSTLALIKDLSKQGSGIVHLETHLEYNSLGDLETHPQGNLGKKCDGCLRFTERKTMALVGYDRPIPMYSPQTYGQSRLIL